MLASLVGGERPCIERFRHLLCLPSSSASRARLSKALDKIRQSLFQFFLTYRFRNRFWNWPSRGPRRSFPAPELMWAGSTASMDPAPLQIETAVKAMDPAIWPCVLPPMFGAPAAMPPSALPGSPPTVAAAMPMCSGLALRNFTPTQTWSLAGFSAASWRMKWDIFCWGRILIRWTDSCRRVGERTYWNALPWEHCSSRRSKANECVPISLRQVSVWLCREMVGLEFGLEGKIYHTHGSNRYRTR